MLLRAQNKYNYPKTHFRQDWLCVIFITARLYLSIFLMASPTKGRIKVSLKYDPKKN